MKINVYEFKGSQLAAMPENERILLVQFAHLSNCISMLYKYVFYTATPPSNETIIEEEFAAQHYFFIRIFAGILNEGWECIEKSYSGTKLSLKYKDKIKSGNESLKFLNKYFKGNNIIRTIRREFSFHFDRDTIKNMFNANNEFHDNTLNIYSADDSDKGIGNSLFNFSENIIAWSMFHRISKENYMGAYETINKEVIAVAKHFMNLTHNIIWLIIKEHLGDNDGNCFYKTLDIERETINNVKIPFFVSKSKKD